MVCAQKARQYRFFSTRQSLNSRTWKFLFFDFKSRNFFEKRQGFAKFELGILGLKASIKHGLLLRSCLKRWTIMQKLKFEKVTAVPAANSSASWNRRCRYRRSCLHPELGWFVPRCDGRGWMGSPRSAIHRPSCVEEGGSTTVKPFSSIKVLCQLFLIMSEDLRA